MMVSSGRPCSDAAKMLLISGSGGAGCSRISNRCLACCLAIKDGHGGQGGRGEPSVSMNVQLLLRHFWETATNGICRKKPKKSPGVFKTVHITFCIAIY